MRPDVVIGSMSDRFCKGYFKRISRQDAAKLIKHERKLYQAHFYFGVTCIQREFEESFTHIFKLSDVTTECEVK